MSPSDAPTFASLTPMRIGAVALAVRDVETVADFYRELLGLTPTSRDDGSIALSAGGTTLLALESRPDARADEPREAGLFHTAFLMPTRADLASWTRHCLQHGWPLDGASDHDVSEAIYLSDPEDNGIEVYADRPPDRWRWDAQGLEMGTRRLDMENLLASAPAEPASYGAAPAGLRIGHVHLRVGELGEARRFYRDILGLDVTTVMSGAVFLSSGRYHHHLGLNIWRSAGAGRRSPDRAGLAWFEIESAPDKAAMVETRLAEAGLPHRPIGDGLEFDDPWGTRIRLVPG